MVMLIKYSKLYQVKSSKIRWKNKQSIREAEAGAVEIFFSQTYLLLNHNSELEMYLLELTERISLLFIIFKSFIFYWSTYLEEKFSNLFLNGDKTWLDRSHDWYYGWLLHFNLPWNERFLWVT